MFEGLFGGPALSQKPMSNWTHSICDNCWAIMHSERPPVRTMVPEQEKCCVCGQNHRSGIYMRGNPANWLCQGKHEEKQ